MSGVPAGLAAETTHMQATRPVIRDDDPRLHTWFDPSPGAGLYQVWTYDPARGATVEQHWQLAANPASIAAVATQADTTATTAQAAVSTIQGRISRVVEVALTFALLGSKTIAITFNPPMPDTNYVLFQSKTGGTLGLAQINFATTNKTVNGCTLTAQGLALGTIGVAILTVPPYGATAVVS